MLTEAMMQHIKLDKSRAAGSIKGLCQKGVKANHSKNENKTDIGRSVPLTDPVKKVGSINNRLPDNNVRNIKTKVIKTELAEFKDLQYRTSS